MVKLFYKDIEPIFERAILELLDKHDTRTVGSVVQWFKIEYGGYAFHDQLFNWEYVVFPKEEDATMFMLKFS